MLNASKGKIYFIPEVMAVYRIHANGIWSNNNLTFKIEKWAEMLGYLVDHFKNREDIHKILLTKYAENLNWLSELYANDKQYQLSSDYLVRALQSSKEFSIKWSMEYDKLKMTNQHLSDELQIIKQQFLFRLSRVIKNPGLLINRVFPKDVKLN